MGSDTFIPPLSSLRYFKYELRLHCKGSHHCHEAEHSDVSFSFMPINRMWIYMYQGRKDWEEKRLQRRGWEHWLSPILSDPKLLCYWSFTIIWLFLKNLALILMHRRRLDCKDPFVVALSSIGLNEFLSIAKSLRRKQKNIVQSVEREIRCRNKQSAKFLRWVIMFISAEKAWQKWELFVK